MKGAYHWRDGWHFARMADGSVEVYVAEASTRGPVKARAVIPASEWASIVHSLAHPAADFYVVEAALNGAPMRVDYTLATDLADAPKEGS